MWLVGDSSQLYAKLDKIMATQAELQASLEALGTQLDKVSAELNTEIQNLTDAVAAAGNTTPEIDAAVQKMQQIVDALDALNPDV